jgi:hypothetical protein
MFDYPGFAALKKQSIRISILTPTLVFFCPISLPNCSVLCKTYLEPLTDKTMDHIVVAKDKTSNPYSNDFV